jgi:RNase P/RNase MRP subunit p30
MREFIDLSLRPKDETELEFMLQTAKTLGYSAVGMEKTGLNLVDIIHRVDLHPWNQNDLSKQLRKLRHSTEVIVVHCGNKSVARHAAHDHRVDLVRYPVDRDTEKRLYIDRKQAGIMRDTGAGFEVCIKDLLVDDRHLLVKRVVAIKKSLDIALKYGLPIVVSSGAEDRFSLRDPHGLAALMSLLGVDIEPALDMVSTNPTRLVTANREKLKNSYVLPGVWVIETE